MYWDKVGKPVQVHLWKRMRNTGAMITRVANAIIKPVKMGNGISEPGNPAISDLLAGHSDYLRKSDPLPTTRIWQSTTTHVVVVWVTSLTTQVSVQQVKKKYVVFSFFCLPHSTSKSSWLLLWKGLQGSWFGVEIGYVPTTWNNHPKLGKALLPGGEKRLTA